MNEYQQSLELSPTTGLDVLNVRDFDARGDCEHLDSPAIQQAIDSCSQAGGGTVHVPNGQYVIGTIRLKANVTLHLAPEAVLLGSQRIEDYDELQAQGISIYRPSPDLRYRCAQCEPCRQGND